MIKSLPQSLIATATHHIRTSSNNMSDCSIVPWEHAIGSLHSEKRTNVVPTTLIDLIYHSNINEETGTSFSDWVKDTEPSDHRLSIESYLTPSYKDGMQMSKRVLHLPETHSDLFLEHTKHLSNTDINTLHDFVHIGHRNGNTYPSGSFHINTHLLNANNNHFRPSPLIVHANGEKFSLINMDRAVGKNLLSSPLTTYSGIKYDPSEHVGENGIINSPMYHATSTRKFTAAKYALTHGENIHHILEFNNKVGDPGIYIGNRNKITSYSDDEYIIPRGERIRLNPVPNEYHSIHNGVHRIFKVWKTERPQNTYYDL